MRTALQRILLCILCMIVNVCFAIADNEKIICPSVDIMQQTSKKIDQANGGKYDDSYSTSASSSYYEKDTHLSWFISAYVPNASSREEAILIGRTIVHHIQFSKQQYANVYTDRYGIPRISCSYGPGEVYANARRLS